MYGCFYLTIAYQKNQDPNRGLKNISAGFNTELHVSQSIHLKYCNSHPSNLPKNVYYPKKLYNSRLHCVLFTRCNTKVTGKCSRELGSPEVTLAMKARLI